MRLKPSLAFFLVVFALFSSPIFSENPPDMAAYNDLLIAVHDVAPANDQKDKVREVWNIGHLIEVHAAQHQMYSDYDAILNQKLAADLKQPLDMIHRMRRFARLYAAMPEQKLDWWHYQAIMDIPDPLARQQLAIQDEREKWTSEKLQEALKKFRASNAPVPEKSLRDNLHFYEATVTEVLDGDTFNAVVDLGFGIKNTQKFRLAGLDAPELPTKDGLAAKEFLVREMNQVQGHILLKSLGLDKYNRYLADVWISGADEENLNQKLIQSGMAKKVF